MIPLEIESDECLKMSNSCLLGGCSWSLSRNRCLRMIARSRDCCCWWRCWELWLLQRLWWRILTTFSYHRCLTLRRAWEPKGSRWTHCMRISGDRRWTVYLQILKFLEPKIWGWMLSSTRMRSTWVPPLRKPIKVSHSDISLTYKNVELIAD